MIPTGWIADKKNGDPLVPIFLAKRLCARRLSSWGFGYLTRTDAAGAGLDSAWLPVNERPNRLEIRIPPAIGLIIRVAHIVPVNRAFATDITNSSHR